MEIELQSLISNKMGKCLAIIMKVTFHRKKIAIVSRKTANLREKLAGSTTNRLSKKKYLLTQQFFRQSLPIQIQFSHNVVHITNPNFLWISNPCMPFECI